MKSGFGWRLMMLIVVCGGLPLLAMPKVRRQVEDWVHGQVDRVIPAMPDRAPPPLSPQAAPVENEVGRASPASFNNPLPAAPPLLGSSNDASRDLHPATPPLLSPIPNQSAPFGGSTSLPVADRTIDPVPMPPPSAPSDRLTPFDNATAAQVRRIREELEDLGAEYILLESADGGRSFRFHCQMAIDARREQLQPFEATTPNALGAAQAVLEQVKLWRRQAPLGN